MQDIDALFVANPFAARKFLKPLLAFGAVASTLLTVVDSVALLWEEGPRWYRGVVSGIAATFSPYAHVVSSGDLRRGAADEESSESRTPSRLSHISPMTTLKPALAALAVPLSLDPLSTRAWASVGSPASCSRAVPPPPCSPPPPIAPG